MWLKTAVVGIKPGPKAKGIEVFLHYSANQCPFTITDQSLAAFCFPLGADSQTPKDRMAPEVRMAPYTQLQCKGHPQLQTAASSSSQSSSSISYSI
jgi:hypothetical protein